MGKKGKGRGRGRGRGRGSAVPQVGQGNSTEQDEPKRPGAGNEEKKAQEERAAKSQKSEGQPQPQKMPQQQNPTHPTNPPQLQYPTLPQNPIQQPKNPLPQQKPAQHQKPTQKPETLPQEQKTTIDGATGIQTVDRTSLNDDKQLSQASNQQTRHQQGEGRRKKRGKQASQHPSKEEGATIDIPTSADLPKPQQTNSHDRRRDLSQQQQDSNDSSDRKGQTSTPPTGNTSLPQGNGRNTTQNGQQLVASAMSEEKPSHLKQQTQALPRRPGYGNQGRLIKLKANFFKLDFRKVDFLYHYDIDIKPEKTPVSECRKVVNAAIDKYLKEFFDNHRPAFDGKKNLYSRKKLPSINGEGCVLDVVLPGEEKGKERHFKLTVKYAAQVPVEDLNKFLDKELQGGAVPEAVQALDIVLRQIPSRYFTPVGRSFFPSNKGGYPLGGGCEVRTGFYQSVRPSQWKTMLVNIDVSSKGFMKAQKVIDLLCEIFDIRQEQSIAQWKMDQCQQKKFLDVIKGFKVETNHIPGKKRKYLVCGLGRNASDYKFSHEESGGKMISVKDYFKKTYDINLRYPQLPCLIVGQKKNHLPMEVCEMVESQKRRLTDDQTAAMIKKVTRPASERKKDIEEWAGQLERNSENYLQKEFGMKINASMEEVDGRVLPAPKVSLGDKGTIVPRYGAWDMRGNKFFQGAAVNKWAMVCFDPRCDDNATRKFSQVLADVCSKEGMKMNKYPCEIIYPPRNDTVEQVLSSLVDKHKDLQLILVVLPSQGNKEIYKEVKRVADTILGILTSCVQTKHFSAAKPQVCSNIAMKINAKLGGINHIVDPSSMPALFKKVIVFGADVTHPSPGESNIPSLAAVVASIDPHASKYAARVRAQTHMKDKSAQEIILEMRVMVKDLLIEFYKATGKTKPERIIFYRDGVSEGQFDQVLAQEVKAVQQACLDLEKDYQPAITFIVVQKRHHARLFCANKKDESGKAGNVPPGTMVDQGITHPYEFDFYLCSHQGIQGTSRPTHYHVLYDDNDFDANSLQKLTYHLCHTYARCTRSVSMPAPAYYAHLVAFRARHHLNGLVSNKDGSKTEELLEEFRKAIKVNDKMKQAMYFA